MAPRPYDDPLLTDIQLPVRPRRQRSHSPQEIWNGTTTMSPGRIVATLGLASTTVAMNSCPTANGAVTGTRPLKMRASRSQLATVIGRTMASWSLSSVGAATSRHSSCPGATKVSCWMVAVILCRQPQIPEPDQRSGKNNRVQQQPQNAQEPSLRRRQ